MLALMLIYSLFYLDVLSEAKPLRKFGVSFSQDAKLALSMKQQQKNLDTEKISELEKKRQQIFNDYLLRRIASPVLRDFYSRF